MTIDVRKSTGQDGGALRHLAGPTRWAHTVQAEETLPVLHSRHRQHEAAADLGRLAQMGTAAQDLMDRAVALVAAILEADRVRLLEMPPDEATLLSLLQTRGAER